MGEEVSGAHEDADGGAAGGDRRGEGGDHRGRAFVVDAAREQDLQVRGGVRGAGDEVAEDAELSLPEREAGARADVAAALRAFEDELAGAGLEELLQQAG